MNEAQLTSARFYADYAGFSDLKRQARQESKQAIKQVAQQFEGLFMSMVMKSMRKATPGDPFFSSSQSRFYRDMFDQQITLDMSQRGGLGLAPIIERQLSGQSTHATTGLSLSQYTRRPVQAAPAAVSSHAPVADQYTFASPKDFVKTIWDAAVDAAKKLNVSPKVLIAQAALETGWGKHVPRRSDGRLSFNLFGIKATGGWDGDKLFKLTTEFRDGVVQKVREPFRAYASVADAFGDYVRLVDGNPRYAKARNAASDMAYAQELQRAGYATDPQYANKIRHIMDSDVMRETLNVLQAAGPV